MSDQNEKKKDDDASTTTTKIQHSNEEDEEINKHSKEIKNKISYDKTIDSAAAAGAATATREVNNSVSVALPESINNQDLLMAMKTLNNIQAQQLEHENRRGSDEIEYDENGLDKHGNPKREEWSKKLDFLMSIIGFSVDLASIWRLYTLYLSLSLFLY